MVPQYRTEVDIARLQSVGFIIYPTEISLIRPKILPFKGIPTEKLPLCHKITIIYIQKSKDHL